MSALISWSATTARRSPPFPSSCTGASGTAFCSSTLQPASASRRTSSAKRWAGRNFQPASNIWMRGILEEEHALPHRHVTWVVERSEDVAFTPPKDLRIEMTAPGKKLDQMLAAGEIDALLSPDLPRLFLAGDKRIVRMFPNYKEMELAYFRRTGIFPIMHVTTIKREIMDKYPWVATNLVKAFEAAKNIAYRRIANPRIFGSREQH
jgi:4,5-dihydroxyphthalate decarboxylase